MSSKNTDSKPKAKQTNQKKKLGAANVAAIVAAAVLIVAAAIIFAIAYHMKNETEGQTGQTSGTSQTTVTSQTKLDSEPVEKPEAAQTLLQFQEPQPGTKVATIETSMGNIKVMFFPEQAPKAVENFLTHAEEGYYDGVTFHRVIEDFMIQSGDPEGTGSGGDSIWGGTFEDEFSDELFNFRGALSMANTGAANTNRSQFFIVQATSVEDAESLLDEGYSQEVVDVYEEIGGTPWLDGKHTVFGQVIEGMNIVDAIASVSTTNDKPDTDIIINKITVETVE